jgi:hypothetical protein
MMPDMPIGYSHIHMVFKLIPEDRYTDIIFGFTSLRANYPTGLSPKQKTHGPGMHIRK